VIKLVNTGTKEMGDAWYERKKIAGRDFHQDTEDVDASQMFCKGSEKYL